jgi:hypothetical protein
VSFLLKYMYPIKNTCIEVNKVIYKVKTELKGTM